MFPGETGIRGTFSLRSSHLTRKVLRVSRWRGPACGGAASSTRSPQHDRRRAKLGLAPEPFVVAIIAGVNLSFATPMAYQTNLLVMHAGGYRFMDFVRVGAPLAVLMLVAYAVVIPRFFPF